MAYSEALGVAKEFAEKHDYKVNADQELSAHAAANLASALFGGMLAGGSMSASAVKEGAGARSQVSNLVTWVATIITLLFLTPFFTTLPEAVLGALIIQAVFHILNSRKLIKVRHASPVEFWFGLLAFGGVIFIDVLQGMIIGLVSSMLFMIYQSSRPHVSSLGRVPNMPGIYTDLTRHPENIPVPGILIVRLDGQLYYANAQTYYDRVQAMIEERESPPLAVIFDSSSWYRIDLTSVGIIEKLVKELRGKGIDVYITDVHVPVREYAAKLGLIELIGEDHVLPTINSAVRYIETTKKGE